MCAAKNTEPTGPSFFSIIFCAIIVALLSGSLGFLYLSTYPPVLLSSENDLAKYLEAKDTSGSKPGDVYYFQGSTLRTRTWEVQRQKLLDEQIKSVVLSDGELNAWFSAKFRPVAAPRGDDQPTFLILPGLPNIYISEKGIYISLPTDIIAFGETKKYTVFTKGHFTDSSPVKFVLDELYLNNSAIPSVGFIGQQIMGTLLKAYSGSDEFEILGKAWDRVESVDVLSNTLHLKLK